MRVWDGESSPSAKRTRRFDGLSQLSGPDSDVDEDGVGLRARLSVDENSLPFGVAPFRLSSTNGSRWSSRRGNLVLCDVSIVMCWCSSPIRLQMRTEGGARLLFVYIAELHG